jgi:two-component system nitrogen regulation response regulator NtrX
MIAAANVSSMDKKRILIVDDEAGYLLALRKILQSPEVHIDTAETFEDAMAFLQTQTYQVVIADIRLTMILREEGLDILRFVKKERPESRIIMISGYGNESVLAKMRSLGADLFFEKPISSDILKHTLRSWGIAC